MGIRCPHPPPSPDGSGAGDGPATIPRPTHRHVGHLLDEVDVPSGTLGDGVREDGDVPGASARNAVDAGCVERPGLEVEPLNVRGARVA